MNESSQKNILEDSKTLTLLDSHDRSWNVVHKLCNFVSGGLFSLNDFAVSFIVGGAVGVCCFFVPLPRRTVTSSPLATISFCHIPAFPLTTSPVSASALKEKSPIIIKRKPVFRVVSVERRFRQTFSHIRINQFIPCPLSSPSHMHVSRTADEKSNKNRKNRESRKILHKSKTGFSVGKRMTLDKTNKTKKPLTPKCQAFPIPGGSDVDGGFSVCEKIAKYTKYTYEKNFSLSHNTMKMQIIEDPFLVMTFQMAYERMTDTKLTHREKLEIIHSVLIKTCRYSKVSSTTMFTKQDRNIFAQETYGLHLLLTHPFERSDSFINKASHSFSSFFDWSKPPSPWGELQQRSFDLLQADLALELVDLNTDLGERICSFPLAAKMRSLVPKYFERRALENFHIIDEGIDLMQKQANNSNIIMNSANKLNTARFQTLVNEFNTIFPDQRPYGELFCSVTGQERSVSKREPFDFLDIVLPD